MRRCRKNNRTTVCCYFNDLHIEPEGNTCRVIGVIPGELLTEELTLDFDFGTNNGIDIDRDVLKLAVIERHKNTGTAVSVI